MSKKALYDLREMFCEELEEIARKPEMSAGDLETVHKLTDTIKNIDKICCLNGMDGYSQYGDWRFDGSGNYGRGNSYARERDSKGRYMGRTHYSRDDAKNHMIYQLESMLEEASNEKERNAITRCMEQLEKA